MTREHTIELSASDSAALCTLFLDGRLAALGHGTISITVRPGQHVRWFVRSRRRNATFALVESRRGNEQLVDEGRCEGGCALGEHVSEKRRARASAAAVSGARLARAEPSAARAASEGLRHG